MAEWLGILFSCDLKDLPAFADDEVCEGIMAGDEYFVGNRAKR